nr:ATP-binding cassette domain-containing protein [Angustibacter aerolatus]
MHTGPTAELDKRGLISLMLGRDAGDLAGGRTRLASGHAVDDDVAPVLSARHLSRRLVLDDVTVEVRPGQVVGLAGLLGSGRSETAKAVFGAMPLDGGEVRVGDTTFAHQTPASRIGHGVAMLPEDRKTEGIVPDMSIRDNIGLAALPRLTRGGLVSGRKARRAWSRCSCAGCASARPARCRRCRRLSGGNQQKVLLARLLCLNPRVLLLDEPTRGIDVGAKAEVQALIAEPGGEGHGGGDDLVRDRGGRGGQRRRRRAARRPAGRAAARRRDQRGGDHGPHRRCGRRRGPLPRGRGGPVSAQTEAAPERGTSGRTVAERLGYEGSWSGWLRERGVYLALAVLVLYNAFATTNFLTTDTIRLLFSQPAAGDHRVARHGAGDRHRRRRPLGGRHHGDRQRGAREVRAAGRSGRRRREHHRRDRRRRRRGAARRGAERHRRRGRPGAAHRRDAGAAGGRPRHRARHHRRRPRRACSCRSSRPSARARWWASRT